MKKRNNKTIVLIVIGIIFIVLFGIFILNYSKDDASFSILEKKWISDNTSNIIDVSVYNDVPVYGNKGKGVIFDLLNDFTSLMDTIYAYGSKEAIKIAATMQKENYTLRNTVSFNKYRAISMYILLATQIKSDVTGIRVSPELWLEMKITDYANNKDEFKKVNNDIVRELKLGSSFCI